MNVIKGLAGILIFFGFLACLAVYEGDVEVKPQPCPCPAPAPTPEPTPRPDPVPDVVRLLIVTSSGCGWCDRLKADWPHGFGVPHQYVQETREIHDRWRIEGTPTLIALDADGNELRRHVGWASKDKIVEWLKGDIDR